jgi:glycosyltransferase involved in cell wall biosynthesis
MQNWRHIEIIVADDASSDSSWELINTAAQSDCRIKAIHRNKNGGPAAARNTILTHAQGEFVAFFDDDDESLPDRLCVQYQAIVDYEKKYKTNLIACYVSGTRYYPNGYLLDMPAIGSRPECPYGNIVVDYLLFNGRTKGYFYGCGTPACSLMARLSTFRATGGLDENLCRVEDIDFAVRLALMGGHFIGCSERLFNQYSTTAPDKSAVKNFEAELYVIDRYADYLKKKKRYYYARSWFSIRYYHFSRQHYKFLIVLFFFFLRYPVAGTKHFLFSAPKRWMHERMMNKNYEKP